MILVLTIDVASGKQNPLYIKVMGVKLKRKSKKWAGITGLYPESC